MKYLFLVVLALICFGIVVGCTLLLPHMPSYTPEPFPELDGKAFAALLPWKEHPDLGSYLVIYDLENLKTVKRIPLEGVSSFLGYCYYWNGKYYFQSIKFDFGHSWITSRFLGVVNSKDGKVKYLDLGSHGHCTGITQDGKMYILGGFSGKEEAIIVTVVDAEKDEGKVKYYKPSCIAGTFSDLGTNYINPASGYAYFWEEYAPKTRILRFRTSDDALEEVYNFGVEIQGISGAVSEDGKHLYIAINFPNVLGTATPSILNEQNVLVIIDTEKKNIEKVVGLPSPEWLFGVNIPEKDWATAWVAVYKDWVYIPAWREPDVTKGIIFKYNVNTGEFAKIDGELPAMYSFDIIGDKLVAVTSYGTREKIMVIDLETDKILVKDQSMWDQD